MVGFLFLQEMVLASRRTRDYVFRWVYACWLVFQLAGFTVFTFFELAARGNADFQNFIPCLARRFYEIFLVQHLILIALVTPAFVAGAITDEKTRGTLQYLLTTELSPLHLIIGKLLGRVVQVLSLALVGLPLFCFVGVFGGLELPVLLGVVVVTIEVVVGMAAATLLAAVWSRQTRDAVLGLLALALALWGAAQFLGGPFRYFDPVHLLSPSDNLPLPTFCRQLLLGLAAWCVLSLGCLALASWRLRPAYQRQLVSAVRRTTARWLPARRPVLGNRPVHWRERYVEGLAPVQLLKRFPRWLGVSLLALGTLLSSGLILWCSLAPGITARTVLNQLVNLQVQQLAGAFMPADYGFWWQGIVALLFFSLLAGIRCSGSISGERERQTWEALLLTPLTEQELIRGKLWGIMGVSYGCVLAYAVPAVALSFLGGPGAIFWTMVWLLVTFLAMFYTGSAGMWSSVRSRSSWRSLLSTLGWGYVGGFIVFLCTVPIILYLVLFILIALELLDHLLGTSFSPNTGTGFAQVLVVTSLAVCIGLALLFWGGSRFFLHYAQKWVAERERTRFWQDEPRMPHRRRCLARLR